MHRICAFAHLDFASGFHDASLILLYFSAQPTYLRFYAAHDALVV